VGIINSPPAVGADVLLKISMIMLMSAFFVITAASYTGETVYFEYIVQWKN